MTVVKSTQYGSLSTGLLIDDFDNDGKREILVASSSYYDRPMRLDFYDFETFALDFTIEFNERLYSYPTYLTSYRLISMKHPYIILSVTDGSEFNRSTLIIDASKKQIVYSFNS